MRNGLYEPSDFANETQRHPADRREIAEQANALIPQLLQQLAGDGEFTAKDLSGFSVKLSNRGETWDGCNGSDELLRDLNTKLHAIRAKDRAELSSQTKRLVELADQYTQLVGENARLREQIEELKNGYHGKLKAELQAEIDRLASEAK